MYLTEKEILARQQEQLFGIQKISMNSKLDLDEIAEIIPGMVHLNKIHTLDVVYIDKQSREILELEKEEVLMNGRQILHSIVKPESFELAKRLFAKKDFNDPSQVVSHFQALKGFSDKNAYEWFFSVKKRFNDKLILSITNPIHSLGSTHKQLKKLLEENLYIRKNLPKISSLTRREKEIIRLIYRGYKSKQISELLFISVHTVRTHRKNIWNKLEIKNYSELFKFAGQFDLI